LPAQSLPAGFFCAKFSVGALRGLHRQPSSAASIFLTPRAGRPSRCALARVPAARRPLLGASGL
jgi:hypothetical protein